MELEEAEHAMAAHPNARTGHIVAIAALFACLAASPALAQDVPLPTPHPAATKAEPKNTGSTISPAKPAAATQVFDVRAQTVQPQKPAFNNPFEALLGKTGPTITLKPEQRAIIDKINNYLSGVHVLSGRFVQVGPDGGRTQGQFYISKPGKVRFEYDDPSPIELVADGQSVVVRDRKLATQDVYPLSQTPLRFLLSDRVDLMKDSSLVAIYADDVFITAVVEEQNGVVGTSKLMIMFSATDMQLKQWTVTDPQGYDTTVAVYNLDSSRRPDPSMFKIDFTQYRN